MPFINGRYYMSPQYGAAIENTRLEADDLPEEDSAFSEPQLELLAARNIPQRAQPKTPPAHNQNQNAKHLSGDATYYDLPGSKTASGHPFNPNKMSAAMTGEKARLGKHVTVTYSHKDAHGKAVSTSISVVVDDRGPFARDPHGPPIHPLRPDPQGVIDLTPAAFKELTGSLKKGRVPVTVTVPNE